MQFSTGRTSALFRGHTHKPSFYLAHGGQCKFTCDLPSALPSGDGAQISLTCLICNSSVRIFWHVPNAIPTSSATSLIVRCRSARMISCTRATVSSVWEVDSLPGQGSSSKDWRPLLKWEYVSNVFYRLRQDSPKAACSISYVSAPVFPKQKQKLMHMRC